MTTSVTSCWGYLVLKVQKEGMQPSGVKAHPTGAERLARLNTSPHEYFFSHLNQRGVSVGRGPLSSGVAMDSDTKSRKGETIPSSSIRNVVCRSQNKSFWEAYSLHKGEPSQINLEAVEGNSTATSPAIKKSIIKSGKRVGGRP